MSELPDQLSPYERLKAVRPHVAHNALIADKDRCFCGHCEQTIPQDVEYQTCPTPDCDTFWQYVVLIHPEGSVPPAVRAIRKTLAQILESTRDGRQRNHMRVNGVLKTIVDIPEL